MTSRFLRILSGAVTLLAVGGAWAAPSYRVDYTIGFDPAEREAIVEIRTTPGTGALKRLRMTKDPERHGVFKGDGKVTRDGDRITWRPPEGEPASLRFRYKVDRKRDSGAYDARITRDWALLRGDRLIPPASALAEGSSMATLRFELPEGWNGADIGYRLSLDKSHYVIANPGRRFQQPLGWMIAGDIGTRREYMHGTEFAVAAPKGQDVRRNDVLAFVHATALELLSAFGRLPPKVLIVGAGDPMWRGGLSAPNSLYLHADRPLVGEGGTSPLLHELVHVITRIRGVRGQDWIAESFAEYYSITVAQRSGLVSDTRTHRALELLRSQGRNVRTLRGAQSSGARTARGVILLVELDAEIRAQTNAAHNLDAVTRQLVGKGRISLEQLKAATRKVTGKESQVLASPLLGG